MDSQLVETRKITILRRLLQKEIDTLQRKIETETELRTVSDSEFGNLHWNLEETTSLLLHDLPRMKQDMGVGVVSEIAVKHGVQSPTSQMSPQLEQLVANAPFDTEVAAARDDNALFDNGAAAAQDANGGFATDANGPLDLVTQNLQRWIFGNQSPPGLYMYAVAFLKAIVGASFRHSRYWEPTLVELSGQLPTGTLEQANYQEVLEFFKRFLADDPVLTMELEHTSQASPIFRLAEMCWIVQTQSEAEIKEMLFLPTNLATKKTLFFGQNINLHGVNYCILVLTRLGVEMHPGFKPVLDAKLALEAQQDEADRMANKKRKAGRKPKPLRYTHTSLSGALVNLEWVFAAIHSRDQELARLREELL
jgi:hypothetical protein